MSEVQQVARMPSRTSRRFNLISAAMAFALWGLWAFWANSDAAGQEGSASPLSSGLTQGAGSFVITLLMVRAVTWLYHHLPAHSIRLVLPALITVVVTGSCLATAHTLVGTPHIVRTIAPAISVAFLFNVYTTAKIHRAETGQEENRHGTTGAHR
jgi:hypothetical protein